MNENNEKFLISYGIKLENENEDEILDFSKFKWFYSDGKIFILEDFEESKYISIILCENIFKKTEDFFLPLNVLQNNAIINENNKTVLIRRSESDFQYSDLVILSTNNEISETEKAISLSTDIYIYKKLDPAKDNGLYERIMNIKDVGFEPKTLFKRENQNIALDNSEFAFPKRFLDSFGYHGEHLDDDEICF